MTCEKINENTARIERFHAALSHSYLQTDQTNASLHEHHNLPERRAQRTDENESSYLKEVKKIS